LLFADASSLKVGYKGEESEGGTRTLYNVCMVYSEFTSPLWMVSSWW